MSRLLDAAGTARFIFVAGKGGVGKTTAAGAIALALADAGIRTHLISVDPAHSLSDLFGEPLQRTSAVCSEQLVAEEFDATAQADAWLAHALAPMSALVEAGTYLDADDVRAFSTHALPGVDELMAVQRLAELSRSTGRIVVDTAPTGHLLRLLDAAGTHGSLAAALRAMAAKAAAVASGMVGASVHLVDESIIDELEDTVLRYTRSVLASAAFVVVTRNDRVVVAETERLLERLSDRGLRTVALVWTGDAGELATTAPTFAVPIISEPTHCHGLRGWHDAVRATADPSTSRSAVRVPAHATRAHAASDGAASWLIAAATPLMLVTGKGGVGKSTCAAAIALTLADSRRVLLCSTDPAGSLDDVLAGGSVAGLRVAQIDPTAQLGRLRDMYHIDVEAALERIGLSSAVELDRRVVAALWELSPPGIDELAATAALLDGAAADETIVLDTAPTGHFLRLLQTPEIALAWTRQLMRVIVKYGISRVAPDAVESVLRLSRELKALTARLHDPQRTAAIVVSLPEPMVQAETSRLIDTLNAADIRVAALLLNRADAASTGAAAGADPVLLAPELDAPPVGVDALREFVATWNIVA
jgi:arsenite/tail-anchored protein-transporting ATPase